MALRSFSSPPVRVLLAVLAAAWLVLVPAGAGRAAASGGPDSGHAVAPPRLPHRGLACPGPVVVAEPGRPPRAALERVYG